MYHGTTSWPWDWFCSPSAFLVSWVQLAVHTCADGVRVRIPAAGSGGSFTLVRSSTVTACISHVSREGNSHEAAHFFLHSYLYERCYNQPQVYFRSASILLHFDLNEGVPLPPVWRSTSEFGLWVTAVSVHCQIIPLAIGLPPQPCSTRSYLLAMWVCVSAEIIDLQLNVSYFWF